MKYNENNPCEECYYNASYRNLKGQLIKVCERGLPDFAHYCCPRYKPLYPNYAGIDDAGLKIKDKN